MGHILQYMAGTVVLWWGYEQLDLGALWNSVLRTLALLAFVSLA